MKSWMVLGALAGAACGDDASVDPSDGMPDAAITEPDAREEPDPDAPIDAPPTPFEVPAPIALGLSATGPDQVMSAAATPDGGFVLAGFAAATPTGPRAVVVTKIDASGVVTTFGTQGIATTPLVFVGGNDEIDIAVQSTGKLVISATVADETVPTDKDMAVVRLAADGTLDTTFGVGGVRVLDLSTGITSGTTTTAGDVVRAIAIGPSDTIYVHGAVRNETGDGTRTDTDFALTRLTANGTPDATFGTGGTFRFDFNYLDAPGTPAPVTARGVKVLADGSAIASGYTATAPGTGMPVTPLLYRVTPQGTLDESFASGLFYEVVLARQTEVYNFALHDNDTKLVTAGYGRDSGDNNKWISLRFDVATGARDLTWGGAPNGAVVFDPSGGDVTNNARNAIALPGGKTLMLGSSGTGNPDQDAAFAVLAADGTLDPAYGDGTHTLALGANATDHFWGAAASSTHVVIVGYSGVGATQTETANDDAFAVAFPVR